MFKDSFVNSITLISISWVRRSFVIALIFLTFLTPATSGAVQRLALVIGNDTYQNVGALQNARSDARAMAKALEASGFRVTLRTDLTDKTMKEAMRTFKGQIVGGDEVVFYFSGHGVQLGASNYLLPVDIKGESEEQVKDDALALQRVLDDLQDQRAGFSLAIIDACRNNPFKGYGHRSIGGRGLAPTSAATGQMVLFSAGAGQEALDNLGESDRSPNGLFTRVLLVEMKKPGIPVDRVLHNVRDEVVRLAKSVGHDQVPALYDQALGNFYFHSERPSANTSTKLTSVNVESPEEVEQELWNTIKASQDPEDFKGYLESYPSGKFAVIARQKAKNLPGQLLSASGSIANADAASSDMESLSWESVKESSSATQLERYLQEHPNSRYAELAVSKLNQLKLINSQHLIIDCGISTPAVKDFVQHHKYKLIGSNEIEEEVGLGNWVRYVQGMVSKRAVENTVSGLTYSVPLVEVSSEFIKLKTNSSFTVINTNNKTETDWDIAIDRSSGDIVFTTTMSSPMWSTKINVWTGKCKSVDANAKAF